MVKGGFEYKHLFMSQNPDAQSAFKTLLNELRPTKILEIGTFHGGLTLALRDILDELDLKSTSLKTYDTEDQKFLKPIVEKNNLNIDVITKNLFSQSYLEWKDEAARNEIAEYVQSGEPCLVLCDGGCKRCEFNLIAPLLKIGDVIMAHDYAPNKEYFETNVKDKIWDWHEIEDSHISMACENNGLSPYLQDICQKAVWCSRIKAV